MNIRQAKAGDEIAIERVAERSWESDYPGILNRENIEDGVHEWYGEDQIRNEIGNEDAIVVVATGPDDDIIGFGHGIWTRRTGHILRVYVDPDHRGQGIGRELLATVRDSLLTRGADSIQAMVLADNEIGNQFYQDVGFQKVDEEETTIGGDTYTENVYRRRD